MTKRTRWLLVAMVGILVLVAETLRSRSAATYIVRTGTTNFTEHVSTRMHVYCQGDLGFGPHWHVTFAVPAERLRAERLAGRPGPDAMQMTEFVSWSETWDEADAIAKRSQSLMYR